MKLETAAILTEPEKSEAPASIVKPKENELGRARQILEISGKVTSNVNVIASSEVEKRMKKFETWLSSNFKNREPSSFSPSEKDRIIQEIEELNGITYPLGRLFHGNPNHVQNLSDLKAHAEKAFRNGIN